MPYAYLNRPPWRAWRTVGDELVRHLITRGGWSQPSITTGQTQRCERADYISHVRFIDFYEEEEEKGVHGDLYLYPGQWSQFFAEGGTLFTYILYGHN